MDLGPLLGLAQPSIWQVPTVADGTAGNYYPLAVTPQGSTGAPGTTQQLTVTESPTQPMALTVTPQGSTGTSGSTQQLTVN